MLVLSRKSGEGIQLGLNGKTARVVVVRIDRGKVRLGIEAAPDVIVMRDEVLDAHLQREAMGHEEVRGGTVA